MRKWDIVRPSKVALWFLGAIAIAYLCIFAIAALWVSYGPQPSWYSPAVQPGAILLDVIVIATVLSGVVVVRRVGLWQSAYLGAGILAGWLLALRISGPLAGLLMPHVPSQPLVTMMLYLAMVMLGALATLRLFRLRGVSGNVTVAGSSTARAKLGRLGIGVAVGLVISGVLVTSLARVSFDVSTVERTWRVGILDAMSESFISPLYVRAARQLTGPWLTSRSFDIAIDGVDSYILGHGGGCTLLDEEGQALGFGSGDLCRDSTVNAFMWSPHPFSKATSAPDILCNHPSRPYYGEGWFDYWCAYSGSCLLKVGDDDLDYVMFTSNDQTCTLIRRTALEDGWPLPVESLPLPR